MTANRPLRVFLCHSSNDKPAVRELYQKLRAEPWIQPWLDEEELYPGQDWNMEIEKAVEAADAIIVCLSKGSITKEGYVQREIRIALDYADYKPEGTLFIIPVRLEECAPPKRLARWQYADYFEGQMGRGFERLRTSLEKCANSINLKYSSESDTPDTGGKIGMKKKTQSAAPNQPDVSGGNIQIIVNGDVINSNLSAGNSNDTRISQMAPLNSPKFISSKENKSKNNESLTSVSEVSRGQYEKLVSKVHEQLKPLSAIVVYCLFRHFHDSNEIIFSPFDNNSQFNNANKALEDGYLISNDQFEYCFLINENDPLISKAIKWVEKLGNYLENTIDRDLYELLQSENAFELSVTNKRYWENYLFGKPLY
jgi:hypothetical protein